MKKLFGIFLLCTVSALAIGLAACTDNPQHEHTWGWAYDQSTHWQECDGCDQIQSSGEHDYAEGVCSVCGYADPNYSSHTHTWGWAYDQSTHWQECDGCDQIQSSGEHDYAEGVCSVCDYADPNYSSHTHTYGEWQIFAPSYVDEGSAVKICTTCEVGVEGHSVEIILPTLNDSRYEKIVEDGACIDSGLVIYSITIDGESLTFSIRYINAGHKLKHHPATITCTENGNIEYWECTVCGKYFSDLDANTEIKEGEWIVTAKGHSLEKHESVAPTCTENGNMEYIDCTVCGKYFYERDGELVETVLTDIILPAEGHELQKHVGVPVDCETPGIRDYWECMVCRKYFSDGDGKIEIDNGDLIIPATGHGFSDWHDDRYLGHYRHSSCKHSIFEEVPHEYEDGVCKVCGYVEPQFYFDEDAPDGQVGYVVVYEYGGFVYADVYIPYLLLGQSEPEHADTLYYPQDFFETGYDEQYGTLWTAELSVGLLHYVLNLYCDFESGSTFKIHSLSQRFEFTQLIDEESGYTVYLYQNIHQTPFIDLYAMTFVALYSARATGYGGYFLTYLTPVRTEFDREENCIYWYCALEEGEGAENLFRIDFTFGENGLVSSATVTKQA